MIDPLADNGTTPLTPDERRGLIPTHVTLFGELNELEQNNIAEAALWAFQRKRNILNEVFLKRLHQRMFNHVWRWAGQYRSTERNLGIPPWRIQTEMHQAINDARYWAEHYSFPSDEAAVRFHHRLVFIHPFPNGNGRWSRLASDLFAVKLGVPRFSWGQANLRTANEARKRYIEALHTADNHDFRPLLAFVRS